jgi:hypothetical protein
VGGVTLSRLAGSLCGISLSGLWGLILWMGISGILYLLLCLATGVWGKEQTRDLLRVFGK